MMRTMERHQMTAEGLADLKAELERLESDARTEIAQQIKTAREWGDLKENAEYHAAKDAQAHLETRILVLRRQLAGAEVVERAAGSDVAAFGSTVEVEDEQTSRRTTYQLVSQRDAAPAAGKLSIQSPVGTALRGRRTGDVAVVQTPSGERRQRVVAVR